MPPTAERLGTFVPVVLVDLRVYTKKTNARHRSTTVLSILVLRSVFAIYNSHSYDKGSFHVPPETGVCLVCDRNRFLKTDAVQPVLRHQNLGVLYGGGVGGWHSCGRTPD